MSINSLTVCSSAGPTTRALSPVSEPPAVVGCEATGAGALEGTGCEGIGAGPVAAIGNAAAGAGALEAGVAVFRGYDMMKE